MKTSHELSLEWSGWVLLPVVFGYLTMTRSFAYLGIAPLYIGEATLGLLLLFRPSMIVGTWARAQLRSSEYAGLAIMSALFVLYGFLQCLRGVMESPYPRIAMQNFAFNFYIAYLFAGMWLGERHPNLLTRVIWYLSWANGIYGVAYLAVLGRLINPEDFDAGVVPIFGQPAGSAVAMLGLLAFERNWRRSLIPLMLNAFVMLGVQVRAEWLGFALAVAVLSVLSGRVSRLFLAGLVIAGLLAVGLLVDFKIPSPTARGGVISTRDIVGRGLAALDERAAAELTDNAEVYSGTVSWRTNWWSNLWEVTHRSPISTLFGKGYGYPIWEHNEFDQTINPTPHNIFMYVLTYTGWVGVFIFAALQLCLVCQLWKGYWATGQPFGLCLWILVMVWALFDNKLETPFGAIPFYVLVGMALTSAFASAPSSAAANKSAASN